MVKECFVIGITGQHAVAELVIFRSNIQQMQQTNTLRNQCDAKRAVTIIRNSQH